MPKNTSFFDWLRSAPWRNGCHDSSQLNANKCPSSKDGRRAAKGALDTNSTGHQLLQLKSPDLLLLDVGIIDTASASSDSSTTQVYDLAEATALQKPKSRGMGTSGTCPEITHGSCPPPMLASLPVGPDGQDTCDADNKSVSKRSSTLQKQHVCSKASSTTPEHEVDARTSRHSGTTAIFQIPRSKTELDKQWQNVFATSCTESSSPEMSQVASELQTIVVSDTRGTKVLPVMLTKTAAQLCTKDADITNSCYGLTVLMTPHALPRLTRKGALLRLDTLAVTQVHFIASQAALCCLCAAVEQKWGPWLASTVPSNADASGSGRLRDVVTQFQQLRASITNAVGVSGAGANILDAVSNLESSMERAIINAFKRARENTTLANTQTDISENFKKQCVKLSSDLQELHQQKAAAKAREQEWKRQHADIAESLGSMSLESGRLFRRLNEEAEENQQLKQQLKQLQGSKELSDNIFQNGLERLKTAYEAKKKLEEELANAKHEIVAEREKHGKALAAHHLECEAYQRELVAFEAQLVGFQIEVSEVHANSNRLAHKLKAEQDKHQEAKDQLLVAWKKMDQEGDVVARLEAARDAAEGGATRARQAAKESKLEADRSRAECEKQLKRSNEATVKLHAAEKRLLLAQKEGKEKLEQHAVDTKKEVERKVARSREEASKHAREAEIKAHALALQLEDAEDRVSGLHKRLLEHEKKTMVLQGAEATREDEVWLIRQDEERRLWLVKEEATKQLSEAAERVKAAEAKAADYEAKFNLLEREFSHMYQSVYSCTTSAS